MNESQSLATAATQFVTFRLGDEYFAIDVGHVREILEITEITKVPAAPPFIRGVVNVRGSAIPVVDLRTKFGIAATAETLDSRIVVLDITLDDEACVVGGLADLVDDVIELEPGELAPPPRIAMRWRSELVRAMGRHGDRFIMILNLDAVFSADDLAGLGTIGNAPTTAAS